MKRVILLPCLMACLSLGCSRPSQTQSTSEPNTVTPNSETANDTTNPALSDVSKTPADSRLQEYFERYCDYTGGLGIGFDASHTNDFEFRQHLKKTDDKELKRLFVLEHLYRNVDTAVDNYEKGRKRIGKNQYRQITDDEKQEAKERIMEMLDDLEDFDPGDPQREIAGHRAKLNRIIDGIPNDNTINLSGESG